MFVVIAVLFFILFARKAGSTAYLLIKSDICLRYSQTLYHRLLCCSFRYKAGHKQQPASLCVQNISIFPHELAYGFLCVDF
jgi:hypothetical protein